MVRRTQENKRLLNKGRGLRERAFLGKQMSVWKDKWALDDSFCDSACLGVWRLLNIW